MLTRQEVRQKMQQDDMRETAEKLFNLMLVSVPGLRNDNAEYLAVSEHVIRNAFERVNYKYAPGGPLGIFSKQLGFTVDDIAIATERTKGDLGVLDVPDVEIAITATYIWLASAVHEFGECTIEFMYLNYRIAEPCRNDAALKDRGERHLVEQFHRHPFQTLRAMFSQR